MLQRLAPSFKDRTFRKLAAVLALVGQKHRLVLVLGVLNGLPRIREQLAPQTASYLLQTDMAKSRSKHPHNQESRVDSLGDFPLPWGNSDKVARRMR